MQVAGERGEAGAGADVCVGEGVATVVPVGGMAVWITAVVSLRTIVAVCSGVGAECVAVGIVVVSVSSWVGGE